MKKRFIGIVTVLSLAGCTNRAPSGSTYASAGAVPPPAPPAAPAQQSFGAGTGTGTGTGTGSSSITFPNTVPFFSGNLTGDVTSIGMHTRIVPGAEGRVLTTIGGVATWAPLPVPVIVGGGTSGITQLTGDVTAGPGSGAQSARVNNVGGSSAASINTATVAVSNATPGNSPNQLVKRDGSGNFSGGIVTAVQFVGDGSRLTNLPTSTAPPPPPAPVGASDVGGRLTLASGSPVRTADVVGVTVVYFTPYVHNTIGLFDGTRWQTALFPELSVSVPGTADRNYDVFVHPGSGVPALELGSAWTSASDREPLVRSSGILVKASDYRRRYVGSVRVGASGNLEDSHVRRFVWNYYHRRPRVLYRSGHYLGPNNRTTYVYNANAWRPSANLTTNRVELLVGISEDPIRISYRQTSFNDFGCGHHAGIGVDSTNVPTRSFLSNSNNNNLNMYTDHSQSFSYYVSDGYHFLQRLEIGGCGSTTWYDASSYVEALVEG